MGLKLSIEEVSKRISEINIGGRIVVVENIFSKEIPVFIKHCSTSDGAYADFIYTSAYNRAIKDGFLTVDETIDIMRDRGLIKGGAETQIKDLQKQLAAQKKVLEKTTRVPARRDRVKGIIRNLESKISDILYKKELLLGNTAERRAQEEKFLYLLWKGSYKPEENKKLFWETKEDFEKESDLKFRQGLFYKYISFYHGMTLEEIRYIARGALWRMRYTAAVKTGSNLFGVPISEYTIDQLSLVYWSNYYQSIYEMATDEMPPEEIMEDDDALDFFMENYMEEKKREALASKEGRKDGNSISAWDHNNVIVTQSHEAFDDIKYSESIEAKREKVKANVAEKGTKKG